MRIHRIIGWTMAVLLLLPSSLHAVAAKTDLRSVGFKQVAVGEGRKAIEIGIWYPSQSEANLNRLGPFDVAYANEGEPMAGPFRVVVLSHGIFGRFRNHHLTAAALVRHGYVVVAPNHAHDKRVRKNKFIARLEHRLRDLKVALETLFADPQIGPIVDAARVNGVGYSLGTATLLAAGGGIIDLNRMADHCRIHAEADARFCGPKSDWPAIATGKLPKLHQEPLINGDLALVAPVGQAIVLDETFLPDGGRVGVFGLADDSVLPVSFHARWLRDKLSADQLEYHEYPDAHHFAFVGPFPKWLTDSEDIPGAEDPPGFDRAAFLERINRDIVNFFAR